MAAAGLLGLAVSIGSELLGAGDQSGLGRRQLTLLAVSLGLLLVGGLLASPFGQRHLLRPISLSSSYERPLDPLELGLFFGLAAGLAEAGVRLVRMAFFPGSVREGPQSLWMVPLADVVLLVGLGLAFLLLGRRWAWLAAPRVAGFGLAFVGWLSVLLLFPNIERLALVVLALGLAAQTARMLAGRSRRVGAAIRWSVGWPAALERAAWQRAGLAQTASPPSRRHFLAGAVATVGALALGVNGWERVQARRATAGLRQAPTGASNVLLLVLDTVRARSSSLYGYSRRTMPNLERLAAGGVLFDWALATSPWTLPSHASMFTGYYPHQLSDKAMWHFSAPVDTLAESLAAAGYTTAGFVANLDFCTNKSGISRGFAHYEDYPVSPGAVVQSTGFVREAFDNQQIRRAINWQEPLDRKSAERINHDFLTWHAAHGQQPFFAFLNYFDAHDPYVPPAEFYQAFSEQRPLGSYDWLEADQLSPQEVAELVDAYDGAIAYLDHHLGRLFAELERRGALDNTLVIVTSDHGEQFGEHGLMHHSNSLYLPVLHVPLVLSYPRRVPAGLRVTDPVSLRDLPATVADFLDLSGRTSFPGESWSAQWSGSGGGQAVQEPLLAEVRRGECLAYPAWYPAARGSMRSLTEGSLHYIKHLGDGSEQLYDFSRDPNEQHDLSIERGRQTELERFRAALAKLPAVRDPIST
jgi:arylsulfatase A-like enzyme